MDELKIIGCAMGTIISGFSFGFSSILVSQLYTSVKAAAMLSSFLNIGGLFGSLLLERLINYYGILKSILIGYFISIFGWIMMFLSQEPASTSFSPTSLFLFGRLLTGVGIGIILPSIIIFINEISKTWNINVGYLSQIGIVFGVSFSYIISVFFKWDEICIINICITLFALILTQTLISPYLSKIYLKLDEVKPNTSTLLFHESELSINNNNYGHDCDDTNSQNYLTSSIPLWSLPFKTIPVDERFKLKIAYILIILQQFTGINVIVYFAEDICLYGGSVSYHCTCRFGVLQFCFSLFVTFFGLTIPWKQKLKISALCMSVAHLLYAIIVSTTYKLNLLSELCIVTVLCSNLFAWIPLPYMIIGKLFESNLRVHAISSSVTIGWITSFFVTYTFQFIIWHTSVSFMFYLFSVCCIVNVIFVHYYIPAIE